MKDKVCKQMDAQAKEIIALGNALFRTPELGFKEFKTKEMLTTFLHKHGIEVEKSYFESGFQVSVGNGAPHIGLLCELDAIVTPHHPLGDTATQAAHSCGHSTQCAAMVNALLALKEVLTDKQGTVTLFFTPAEEYVDLAYRQSLIAENRIQYISGKQNMLAAGCFAGIDAMLHLHGMGEYRGYRYNVMSRLAGFSYKKITFHGKATHAAVLPHLGHNALNMFALFQSAVGMLRETFADEDTNRVHGILEEGGSSVNTIPEQTVYTCYVRSGTTKGLMKLNKDIDTAATHCAMALGGTCMIEDAPGYMPFNQNRLLSDIVYQNMLAFVPAKEIQQDERSMASGDIGDVGVMIPSIQFGYTGFTGNMHGKDLIVSDEQQVYVEAAKIVAMTVCDILTKPKLLEGVHKQFMPEMSMSDYLAFLNSTSTSR